MKVESVERVIARIEEARMGRMRPVITTDADGTLWSGDVGDDSFEKLIEMGGVRQAAREALVREAERGGLSTQGDANALAARIYEAFRDGKFSEAICYEMMAWVFAGWTLPEVEAFSCQLFEEQRLDARIHDEMRTLLRWATGQGIEVWVVSASPRGIVEACVGKMGVARERVIAATPAVRDDRIVPFLESPIPYGEGKVRGIDRCIGPCRIVGAFGDEAFDVEMLLRADVPVAVRPKQRLRDRGSEVPGLVELGAG